MTARRDGTLRRGQTITVLGREWFDKANGNSYFSARIYIDNDIVAKIPFGYGYGDQYRYEALELLTALGYITSGTWQHLRDRLGIKMLAEIATGQLQRDVKDWGTE